MSLSHQVKAEKFWRENENFGEKRIDVRIRWFFVDRTKGSIRPGAVRQRIAFP
jgi:hypothetical protein